MVLQSQIDMMLFKIFVYSTLQQENQCTENDILWVSLVRGHAQWLKACINTASSSKDRRSAVLEHNSCQSNADQMKVKRPCLLSVALRALYIHNEGCRQQEGVTQ